MLTLVAAKLMNVCCSNQSINESIESRVWIHKRALHWHAWLERSPLQFHFLPFGDDKLSSITGNETEMEKIKTDNVLTPPPVHTPGRGGTTGYGSVVQLWCHPVVTCGM